MRQLTWLYNADNAPLPPVGPPRSQMHYMLKITGVVFLINAAAIIWLLFG